MTHMSMPVTDMAPFFARHERRARRVFATMLLASVAVAGAIFVYGVLRNETSAVLLAKLWPSILAWPLIIAVLWLGAARAARKRIVRPDGSMPMNPDDARSVAKVANAGFRFVACFGIVVILTQVGIALAHFAALPPLHTIGDWVRRFGVMATGVLLAYFGNVSARMPVPRAPELKPATQLKFKRVLSWLMVIHGLLLALAGMLLPMPAGVIAVIAVSISTVLSVFGTMVVFRRVLGSRSARRPGDALP